MGGERSGKSFQGALQLVCRHQLGSLFWVVAEEFETTIPEMEYIRDFLTTLEAIDEDDREAVSWPKEGSKSIRTKSGVLIESRSASDYRRIAEKAPDGILGCEVGRWRWESFLRVSGRLAEKRGWAWLSGSFERSVGWQAELHRQWLGGKNLEDARSYSFATWDNTVIFPEGENDPEIQRLRASQPADYFSERYGGVPVPPSGRVYRDFEYIIHVSEDAEYQPGIPVQPWIDPGYAGAYVVLAVQEVADGQVNVIDEIYVQNLQNADVINIASRRRWWKDRENWGVIDILGGSQHHSERSPIEAWQQEAHVQLKGSYIHINDQLARVRSFLRFDNVAQRPGLLVSPRCLGLIAEMGAGKHPIDGMGTYSYKTGPDGAVLGEKPLEKNNHAASALACGLVFNYGLVKRDWGRASNYTRGPQGSQSVNYKRGAKTMSIFDYATEFADDKPEV